MRRLLPTLAVLVGCGVAEPGRVSDAPACGFDELVPPKVACDQLAGDALFQGICVVDCLGNVFVQRHVSTGTNGQMEDLPGGRFYAVLFSPLPGSTLSLNSVTVQTFAGYNNWHSPLLGSPAQDPRSAVPNSSDVTQLGDLFVRINKRMDGPIQFTVFLDDGSGSGYMWRAYAGGVPFGWR